MAKKKGRNSDVKVLEGICCFEGTQNSDNYIELGGVCLIFNMCIVTVGLSNEVFKKCKKHNKCCVGQVSETNEVFSSMCFY